MSSTTIIRKLWNHCNELRALQNPFGFLQVASALRFGHDAMSYGDYV